MKRSRLAIIPLLSLALVASSQQVGGQEGINHLVPPKGILSQDYAWDYFTKVRRILLEGAHKAPCAFAFVRTGDGLGEYCVSLSVSPTGDYLAEARQAARNIWYDKLQGENPVEVRRAEISKEKGKEISALWERMLRGVKVPNAKENSVRVLSDGGPTYYACFILGEGVLSGETPNFEAEGGELGRLASLTKWMFQECMAKDKSAELAAPSDGDKPSK